MNFKLKYVYLHKMRINVQSLTNVKHAAVKYGKIDKICLN